MSDRAASPTFWDLLEGITHDGFMIGTWLFTGLTLVVVGLALFRLIPRNPTNPIAPPSRDDAGW